MKHGIAFYDVCVSRVMHEAEVDALREQLAEAVRLLRLVGEDYDDGGRKAQLIDAFLAAHEEER